MTKVQKDLVEALGRHVGDDRILHVPLTAQLNDGVRRERTQRSRSFHFASLGVAVAEMFGLKAVEFFENGVVSLNLPPVAQVVGARATRSAHPKALNGLGRLFTPLLGYRRKVRNPFLLRTKGDVLETMRPLGMADEIERTRSGADVHHLSDMYHHCGRCSQCIDRRFAVLAQGHATHDPAGTYAVDLFDGARPRVQDRERVLSYVRNARFFNISDAAQLLRGFPEIARVIDDAGCCKEEDSARRAV
ncbi:hypothetical protein [Tropicimonas marinistellae]|uniref:hypothetical protein n=1 Tax=Tropicimonas marinistellae TaxID=1739787 RepID=UPI00122E00CE|nr:hypothetical protein [Tropicimonas marinistellae]